MKRRAKLAFTREALGQLFFGDATTATTKITGFSYDECREILSVYLTGPELPECYEGAEPKEIVLELDFRGKQGKFLELNG